MRGVLTHRCDPRRGGRPVRLRCESGRGEPTGRVSKGLKAEGAPPYGWGPFIYSKAIPTPWNATTRSAAAVRSAARRADRRHEAGMAAVVTAAAARPAGDDAGETDGRSAPVAVRPPPAVAVVLNLHRMPELLPVRRPARAPPPPQPSGRPIWSCAFIYLNCDVAVWHTQGNRGARPAMKVKAQVDRHFSTASPMLPGSTIVLQSGRSMQEGGTMLPESDRRMVLQVSSVLQYSAPVVS